MTFLGLQDFTRKQKAKTIAFLSLSGGGESYPAWRVLSGVQVTGVWDRLDQIWVRHPEPPRLQRPYGFLSQPPAETWGLGPATEST